MKLKEISCYQHVKWYSATKAHFNIEAIDKLRDEPMQLTYVAADNVVHIKQGTQELLIPTTNISYMIPADKSVQQSKQEVEVVVKKGSKSK